MTCEKCMVNIPECLYSSFTNQHNVVINELECCITCKNSKLDEYAKMETENCHCLKIWCKKHNTLFDASTYCDEHVTKEKDDQIKKFKEENGL